MQFFLGLLTAVVFFICLAGVFYIGLKQGKKRPAPKPVNEEEQRKRERVNKHFQALFNYDVDTALKKKKVM